MGKDRNVLPQGISMGNMKAVSLLVQKLMQSQACFKSRLKLDIKVMGSKFLVWTERSLHKEHLCLI